MRFLLDIFNRKKDYLIILIIFIFLASPYLIDICTGYLNYYNFDLQEFLLWNYTSLKGFIPYRDIFYPYGLLNYFKNYNLIFALSYYLISPIIFLIIYFIFKKVFKNKFILYFSLINLYLFVLCIVGFQTFTRYGLLVAFSLIVSYIFYFKKINLERLTYLGISLGLLLSVINDVGVYLIAFSIFILGISKSLRIIQMGIKEIVFVLFGFFIGIIPIILFLSYKGNFYAFFDYFKDVGQITVVGKTPFFSFIDSPSNIFTMLILFPALFFNLYKLFFRKHKLTLSSFLQISLIFDILILEQKSIIRSIDRQITFVSLILLMFLVYELIEFIIKKTIIKKVVYVFFMLTVILLYFLSIDNHKIDISSLSKNIELLTSNKCYENNLNFFTKANPSYIKIIDLLKKQPNFNGKVFSFSTGDSAFYVLLDQKPPYYNAIFEGASYNNQISTIKYIQQNKIEYVTLNTSKSSLQDGVPDYVRQSFLFEYILDNYYPFTAIGNHIVLKKGSSDFFASEILKQEKEYNSYLSDVYLYKIPYSEGFYKYNYLKNNNKLIMESDDVTSINFYSTEKALVLIPDINYKSSNLSSIKFQIENGHSTTVYYNTCNKNAMCIINLSKIPLFYKKRVVTKIIPDKGFSGKIEIFDLKNPGNLW